MPKKHPSKDNMTVEEALRLYVGKLVRGKRITRHSIEEGYVIGIHDGDGVLLVCQKISQPAYFDELSAGNFTILDEPIPEYFSSKRHYVRLTNGELIQGGNYFAVDGIEVIGNPKQSSTKPKSRKCKVCGSKSSKFGKVMLCYNQKCKSNKQFRKLVNACKPSGKMVDEENWRQYIGKLVKGVMRGDSSHVYVGILTGFCSTKNSVVVNQNVTLYRYQRVLNGEYEIREEPYHYGDNEYFLSDLNGISILTSGYYFDPETITLVE